MFLKWRFFNFGALIFGIVVILFEAKDIYVASLNSCEKIFETSVRPQFSICKILTLVKWTPDGNWLMGLLFK